MGSLCFEFSLLCWSAGEIHLDNIMYNINVNYTHFSQLAQDNRHKKNLFDYGHIGYFKTTRAKYYNKLSQDEFITIDGIDYYGVTVLSNIYDSIVEFSPTPWGNNDESLISNPSSRLIKLSW